MPGAAHMSVDHHAVDAALSRIDGAIDAIERELDELARRGARLREEWTGDASRAFDEAHRAWNLDLRDLHQIARELRRTAHRGNRRFQSHDEAEARVWRV